VRFGGSNSSVHCLLAKSSAWPRWGIAGLLLIANGCSDNPRNAVSGTVTYGGQPLADGYIKFIPESGTPGPAAGEMIREGVFEIPHEKSVFSGTFRVEIVASRPSKKKMLDQETGEMAALREQYIPYKYNRDSELIVNVEPGSLNEFDFALDEK
jgi:hypothetical protein